MGMDIKPCLGVNNIEEFYKKHIEPEFKVELCSTGIENNIWSNKYRDGEEDAQILAGNDYPNPLSFSHEMLHLYLYANEFSTLSNWFISFPDAYNRLNSCLITSDGVMDQQLYRNKDYLIS